MTCHYSRLFLRTIVCKQRIQATDLRGGLLISAVLRPRTARSRDPSPIARLTLANSIFGVEATTSLCGVLTAQLQVFCYEKKSPHFRKMAGGEEGADLKGLSKYFNSSTNMGRANVAKATYAVLAAVILYNVMKPKKK